MEPKVGDTLRWNGTNWEPGAVIQTYFKDFDLAAPMDVNDVNSDVKTDASHSIVLIKKSRLVISVQVLLYSGFCIGCDAGRGFLTIQINNKQRQSFGFGVSTNGVLGPNISNFMVDLDPGTYNVEFIVSHLQNSPAFKLQGGFSSIMVLPL